MSWAAFGIGFVAGFICSIVLLWWALDATIEHKK